MWGEATLGEATVGQKDTTCVQEGAATHGEHAHLSLAVVAQLHLVQNVLLKVPLSAVSVGCSHLCKEELSSSFKFHCAWVRRVIAT